MDAAGTALPRDGAVFLSVRESDKPGVVILGRRLQDLGFKILATGGTHAALEARGVTVTRIHKLGQGRPDVLDALENDDVNLIINTPVGKGAHTDEGRIRRVAIGKNIPIITTISGAAAAVSGLEAMRGSRMAVKSIQEHHASA